MFVGHEPESKIRAVMEWQPGNKNRDREVSGWLEEVKKHIRSLEVKSWKERAENTQKFG